MSKLIFTHAVMNSGKSLSLLQVNHNYTSDGENTVLLSHKIDNRYGESVIASRLGMQAPCIAISEADNLYDIIINEKKKKGSLACVLADEIQFYTPEQIWQLADIVDELKIPVMCYGLKNNFKGELFNETIQTLLALADSIRELKQVCHCGKKATMILQYDENGNVTKIGQSINVGAESMYRSVCRRHWKEGNLGPKIKMHFAEKQEKNSGVK